MSKRRKAKKKQPELDRRVATATELSEARDELKQELEKLTLTHDEAQARLNGFRNQVADARKVGNQAERAHNLLSTEVAGAKPVVRPSLAGFEGLGGAEPRYPNPPFWKPNPRARSASEQWTGVAGCILPSIALSMLFPLAGLAWLLGGAAIEFNKEEHSAYLLTDKGIAELERLNEQKVSCAKKTSELVAELAEQESTVTELSETIREKKKALSTIKRDLASARKQEKESLAHSRAQEKSARLAGYEGRTRGLARSVKAKLPDDHPCPYCFGELGDSPHADHINPVVMGGTSMESNLVNVCSRCNQLKAHLTLREFCKRQGLHFDTVAGRLEALGKRV